MEKGRIENNSFNENDNSIKRSINKIINSIKKL